MPSLPTTPTPRAGLPPARIKPETSPPNRCAQPNPTSTPSLQANDRIAAAAADAVATTFARILAERHPGTTWLPVERSRSNDGLVVPAGKVVRLLPAPADVNTSAGIGNPTAHERAPYEHSTNPRA